MKFSEKTMEYATPSIAVTEIVTEGILCASNGDLSPNSVPDMVEDVLTW